MILIEYVGHIGLSSLTDGHLGRHLEYFKTSMMPEWHQLDSSITTPQQQESTKKETLKSSSRSFWFSTGLLVHAEIFCFTIIKVEICQKNYFTKMKNMNIKSSYRCQNLNAIKCTKIDLNYAK